MQANTDERAKLGDLLVEADVVSSDVVEIALKAAEGFGMMLGQVLLDTDRLTRADLNNTLLAQSMIRKGLIDENVAISAISFSHRTRLAFSDAVLRAKQALDGGDAMAQAA